MFDTRNEYTYDKTEHNMISQTLYRMVIENIQKSTIRNIEHKR